ncbi:MAG: nucleoid-associated protein [Candidatus Mesenet longicola]|uniref:Nucleoid-associated protein sL5_08100 n=1 Tax=Candidatus Mesenet longicola TaxID=1892558 RepID=A0A8J3MQR1_9RICK|nr:MAG: nucleoid-associated protein [Candidatus Mesenet longicola]GHM59817.1 MAG: nucleoid-associated protein [Candidatus Mesenet longicola]
MDINKIKKQAESIQKKVMEAQAGHTIKEFKGVSAGGKVSVVITTEGMGGFKAKEVNLDDELLKHEDKDIIGDLIVAAFNDALKAAEEDKKNLFSNLASMMGLPPEFKLPF